MYNSSCKGIKYEELMQQTLCYLFVYMATLEQGTNQLMKNVKALKFVQLTNTE